MSLKKGKCEAELCCFWIHANHWPFFCFSFIFIQSCYRSHEKSQPQNYSIKYFVNGNFLKTTHHPPHRKWWNGKFWLKVWGQNMLSVEMVKKVTRQEEYLFSQERIGILLSSHSVDPSVEFIKRVAKGWYSIALTSESTKHTCIGSYLSIVKRARSIGKDSSAGTRWQLPWLCSCVRLLDGQPIRPRKQLALLTFLLLEWKIWRAVEYPYILNGEPHTSWRSNVNDRSREGVLSILRHDTIYDPEKGNYLRNVLRREVVS